MMFRGSFRNSFFGSFFESFGVSPSGEFLGGLGMDGTRFFSSKWGWAAPLSVTTPYEHQEARGYTMLFRATNSGKKYDVTLRLRYH